jgi:hypothetical protein
MDYQEAVDCVINFESILDWTGYSYKEESDAVICLLKEGEKYKKMWTYLSNMGMSGELKEVMNNIEKMF